jgi:phosphate transport system substrate-binding protein
MSRNKFALMLTTAMSAASVLGAGAASAADVYGGGASLPAPYQRNAADCYGVKTDLINAAAAGATTPSLVTLADFNYPGNGPKSPAFDCAAAPVDPNTTIFYSSTGSGRGVQAFGSHDPLFLGDIDPNTAGIQLYGSVQYALSETSVSAAQVGFYNNGGLFTTSVTVVAPGATPGVGQYANPKEKYGAMIQYPFLIAPVTIAYDPVYKKVRQGNGTIKEYVFRLSNGRNTGGLRLDQDTYCKIFNGQITNWNDPALTALNGGVSLKDPKDPTAEGSWSVPMQIAGRSDSSGTTSLWTRHLAAACAGVAGNAYADSTSTLPASLQGVVYDKSTANSSVAGTPGVYVRAAGNDGVAKYIDFTAEPSMTNGDSVVQGRIGYVGPDFTLPASAITLSNDYNLHTATLQNASGTWIAPSPTSAADSFGSILPPDSNAKGKYDAGSLDPRSRANPADWVEPASKTSPLANPTAIKGYPIVGTSNILLYTCYADKNQFKGLFGYLKWYNDSAVVNDKTLGILANSGFSPMPKAWTAAIRETFLGNGSGLNLSIALDGTGTSGCTASTVVGG